jgi:hypothetical protein
MFAHVMHAFVQLPAVIVSPVAAHSVEQARATLLVHGASTVRAVRDEKRKTHTGVLLLSFGTIDAASAFANKVAPTRFDSCLLTRSRRAAH